jgi:hypothetical protein
VARSIRYQIVIVKLPLAKDIDDFNFDDTPISETLMRVARLPSATASVVRPSTLSTWSTSSRPKPAPGGKAEWPTSSGHLDSVVLDELGYRRSLSPAASSCSI